MMTMLISTTPENRQSNIPAGTKITANAASENAEDRFKRQALQAVCAAIAASQSIDITSIRPDSRLATFFPRQNRQQRIHAFQDELGVDIDLLAIKNAVEWTIILSTNISLITLFVSLKAGTMGLAFTAVAGWLAARFGQELAFDTVGQLAEQVAREHYKIPGSGPTRLLKKEINRQRRKMSRADFQVQPAM
jgi:hypothetical protein